MYTSENFGQILEPGLSRIFFKEYHWPGIQKSLGVFGHQEFEQHFKKWIESFPKPKE
jgi:hypothetical protein